MSLKTKKVSETVGMMVYTDNGELFGEVEEAVIDKNKINAWRVRATRDSFLNRALGGAKGVVVPHQLVKAIGNVFIVSRSAAPAYAEEPQ
jgi:sporulation protein YlmC with PRC-barrel domain